MLPEALEGLQNLGERGSETTMGIIKGIIEAIIIYFSAYIMYVTTFPVISHLKALNEASGNQQVVIDVIYFGFDKMIYVAGAVAVIIILFESQREEPEVFFPRQRSFP